MFYGSNPEKENRVQAVVIARWLCVRSPLSAVVLIAAVVAGCDREPNYRHLFGVACKRAITEAAVYDHRHSVQHISTHTKELTDAEFDAVMAEFGWPEKTVETMREQRELGKGFVNATYFETRVTFSVGVAHDERRLNWGCRAETWYTKSPPRSFNVELIK